VESQPSRGALTQIAGRTLRFLRIFTRRVIGPVSTLGASRWKCLINNLIPNSEIAGDTN
jgi:hypothetical protein